MSCPAAQAMAAKALQHVYNKLDAERQWDRAVECLGAMTELQIAQTWQALTESITENVALSRYKVLFKHALRESNRRNQAQREQTRTEQEAALQRQKEEIYSLKSNNKELKTHLEEVCKELFAQNKENDDLKRSLERCQKELTRLKRKSNEAVDE